MLDIIRGLTDSFFSLLMDDPVRPSIPTVERVGNNRDVFVLRDGNDVHAITCVSYQDDVPKSELDLFRSCSNPTIVVFYTIWSYKSGAGRELLFGVVDYIKKNKPEITRFVTLSPKSEMAARFHLKNGAKVFRENETSINYEYEIAGLV